MRNVLILVVMVTIPLGSVSSRAGTEASPPISAPQGEPHVADRGSPGMVRTVNETGSSRQGPGIRDDVNWSLDRYGVAGLAVPDLSVTFHRDRSNCAGFGGLHTGGQGSHQIDVCIGGHSQRRATLLHEIAHVWVSEHIDDSDRQAFLALRGLHEWNHGSVAWEERGTEQAAMVMAWGLGEDCAIPADMVGDDTSTLASAFQFLTGRQPVCGLGRIVG